MDGTGIAWPVVAWLVAGALVLAGAVAVDARERGQPAAVWFVVSLLFPGFGALAYLVLRAPTEAGVWAEPPMPESRTAAPVMAAPVRPPAASASAAPSTPVRPGGTAPTGGPTPGGAEWRRDVGVLPGAPPEPSLSVSAMPPHYPPRGGRSRARWVGVGVAALVAVVGAALLLPRLLPPAGAPPTATPTPAPTTAPAAAPLEASVESASAPEAAAEPVYYTVEPGDSLLSIAEELNTSTEALIQANGLENADVLIVGQRLLVPQ